MISRSMIDKLQVKGGIRQAFNEARRQSAIYGKDKVFDLSIGNPSAPVPAKVNESIIRLASDPTFTHSYMNEAGFEDVRAAIATSLNRKYCADYTADNIIMTNGAAGGLNAIFCALLDPNDEVIVFTPFYPAYEGFVDNWGGRIVKIPPQLPNFFPDYEALEKALSPRTKAVIINSPHNPTGTIYTKEVAQRLSGILKRAQDNYSHDIYLISDEPYRELVYDGMELPWWPDYYDNTIVVYSFSKSLSLAGERIGYTTIPQSVHNCELVTRGVRLALGRIGYVNAPAMFQKVAAACVDEHVDIEYYNENRKILYNAIKDNGFAAVYPYGAFYIFLKSPLPDEEDFLKTAQNRHLIFVGGSTFGYPGYVRVSFCCTHEIAQGAADAFSLLAADCGLK